MLAYAVRIRPVLTPRQLNRATLERQLLLARTERPILDAVTHLVGLQAQVPLDPYSALWSRLDRFDPDGLGRLVVDRAVVRIVVMRGTIHLVTAEDARTLRPLAQPVLDQEMRRHADYAADLAAVDPRPVVEAMRPVLAERARTPRELRAEIEARFPGLPAGALAFACRNLLALVQVPPRGVWGRTGGVRSTTLEAWVGAPLDPAPALDRVLLRYLAAFGPATVADMSTWSRLTGLKEVVARLAPGLRTFHDERGRELFDLPDAPRPHPDAPAPVRFLPEYDNVLLSHADRSRFVTDAERARLGASSAPTARPVHGTVLHDGRVAATWSRAVAPDTNAVTLTVDHLPLPKRELAKVVAEGRRFLRFRDADAAAREVRTRLLP